MVRLSAPVNLLGSEKSRLSDRLGRSARSRGFLLIHLPEAPAPKPEKFEVVIQEQKAPRGRSRGGGRSRRAGPSLRALSPKSQGLFHHPSAAYFEKIYAEAKVLRNGMKMISELTARTLLNTGRGPLIWSGFAMRSKGCFITPRLSRGAKFRE